MVGVITSMDQITSDWLTETLRQAGALERGGVSSFEADTSRTFGSLVSRLSLTYTHDASPDAPRRLFLKVSDPEVHHKWPGRGKREIEFYRAIPADDYAQLPLPRCYDAAASDEG